MKGMDSETFLKSNKARATTMTPIQCMVYDLILYAIHDYKYSPLQRCPHCDLTVAMCVKNFFQGDLFENYAGLLEIDPEHIRMALNV